MRKRFSDQAYLFCLSSFKEARRSLISDSLGSSSDLYKALYSPEKSVRNTELVRYELLVIKRQWESAVSQTKKISDNERSSVKILFVNIYRDYIAKIQGTSLDLYFIEDHLRAIESLLEMNRKWDERLKLLQVGFLKNEKILDDMISKEESKNK